MNECQTLINLTCRNLYCSGRTLSPTPEKMVVISTIKCKHTNMTALVSHPNTRSPTVHSNPINQRQARNVSELFHEEVSVFSHFR